CLIARRMIERGVRFVQIWSGAGGPTGNWDNHADIPKELPPMANATDKPIAGLLKDLKSRGLFEDTLVVWSTEFGRMPFTQGATPARLWRGWWVLVPKAALPMERVMSGPGEPNPGGPTDMISMRPSCTCSGSITRNSPSVIMAATGG